jgi:formylglycine-generating enzyme required for sulfatase activity
MGTTPWKGKQFVREGDSYAATYVSWDDARAFCKKLSEKEKGEYRLPTEAEWEYACRARTKTRFSFGDDPGTLSDYAWWGGLSGDGNAKAEKYPHETGRKQPNPFGLYDMHGNAGEWCEAVYSQKLPGGTDPLVSVEGRYRMYRGGGWSNSAAYCRSARRS